MFIFCVDSGHLYIVIFEYNNMKNETDQVKKWSACFKAMGHETRIRVLMELFLKKECDVTEMQKALKIPQSTLSQHLAVLRNCGLVEGLKDQKRVCYRIAKKELKGFLEMVSHA